MPSIRNTVHALPSCLPNRSAVVCAMSLGLLLGFCNPICRRQRSSLARFFAPRRPALRELSTRSSRERPDRAFDRTASPRAGTINSIFAHTTILQGVSPQDACILPTVAQGGNGLADYSFCKSLPPIRTGCLNLFQSSECQGKARRPSSPETTGASWSRRLQEGFHLGAQRSILFTSRLGCTPGHRPQLKRHSAD